MPYWKCFYHAIWSTKYREPMITTALEKVIFEAVRAKSHSMNGIIHAVNGVADHIHIAVSFPPHIPAAEWVRSVKGLSAHNVNDAFPNLNSHFSWQRGYGLITFGEKALPTIVAYVEQQKSHHANNTTNAYFEQTDDN